MQLRCRFRDTGAVLLSGRADDQRSGCPEGSTAAWTVEPLAPWSTSRRQRMKEAAPLRGPRLLTTLRDTARERDLANASRPTRMHIPGWAGRPR